MSRVATVVAAAAGASAGSGLRAAWRALHPGVETRLSAFEALAYVATHENRVKRLQLKIAAKDAAGQRAFIMKMMSKRAFRAEAKEQFGAVLEQMTTAAARPLPYMPDTATNDESVDGSPGDESPPDEGGGDGGDPPPGTPPSPGPGGVAAWRGEEHFASKTLHLQRGDVPPSPAPTPRRQGAPTPVTSSGRTARDVRRPVRGRFRAR